MPKYPNIVVQLTGQDGNAFSILGRVTRELKRYSIPKDEIDAYFNSATSGDYNNLLRVTGELVTVR